MLKIDLTKYQSCEAHTKLFVQYFYQVPFASGTLQMIFQHQEIQIQKKQGRLGFLVLVK